MRPAVTIAVAALAVGVGALLIRLSSLGAFSTVEPTHDESTCRLVPGGSALEDVATVRLDDGRGGERCVLLWGSDDRQWLRDDGSGRNITQRMAGAAVGTIVALDTTYAPHVTATESLWPVRVKGYPQGRAFLPHGLSANKRTDGSWQVLVVTHTQDGERVASFAVVVKGVTGADKQTAAAETATAPADSTKRLELELHYEWAVTSDVFYGLNDVAAASADGLEFYVSSFNRYEPNTLMSLLENVLNAPWTSVAFCRVKPIASAAAGADVRESKCVHAMDSMRGPNGVNLSPDRRTVYVAELFANEIVVFDRNSDGTLRERQRVPGFGCDNIEVHPSGRNLTVGCHPKLITAAGALTSADPTATAPSNVLAYDTDPRTGSITSAAPRSVFLSAGTKLGAVSVGTVVGGRLYLGSFVPKQPGVLVCDGF